MITSNISPFLIADYKTLVIPANAEAKKFSRVMQDKCLKMILGFLARYESNSNDGSEDFRTAARKWMLEKDEEDEEDIGISATSLVMMKKHDAQDFTEA